MRVCGERGLTLIETLVVAAIAAILVALLLVGGRAAIGAAKVSACAASLGQIGTALGLYAHDNDERYPPYTFMGTFDGKRELAGDAKAFKVALAAYRVADAQFYCPLDAHARTAYLGEFISHMDTSYDMSIDYMNNGHTSTGGFVFSPSGLKDPSRVNLLDDMGEVRSLADGSRVRVTAHGNRTNVLRADGSVANQAVVQP